MKYNPDELSQRTEAQLLDDFAGGDEPARKMLNFIHTMFLGMADLAAPDWNNITNKPAVIAAGATQAAARDAIGAGTSNLTLGTTSTTAKAGDWQPAVTDIVGSTTIGRTLMTAASAAVGRTALALGTAATMSTSAFATAAQGALADTAVQPAALDARLSAAQRAAINALVAGTSTVDDVIAALQAV